MKQSNVDKIKIILSLIILLFVLSLLFNTNSYGQLNVNSDVCFSIEDSKRLVVELEKGRLLEQNIILLEKSNNELVKQTELLKEQVKLMDDKFKSAEMLVLKNEELYNQKMKVMNDELNEAKKPRWKSMFISGGSGAIIALLLVILL